MFAPENTSQVRAPTKDGKRVLLQFGFEFPNWAGHQRYADILLRSEARLPILNGRNTTSALAQVSARGGASAEILVFQRNTP